jgi:hypothetical protein
MDESSRGTKMNDSDPGQAVRRPMPSMANRPLGPTQPANLADLLERVLDKGIVIAGDITLCLGTVEVLTLKIRLLIASVDKAQEIGINWWQSDPALSSRARELEEERDQLKERVDRLEAVLTRQTGHSIADPPPQATS